MLTSLCKCDNLSRERHNLRTLYTHMKKTLITLVALATASVASAAYYPNLIPVAGDFYAGDYAFTFMIETGDIAVSSVDTVLAYWGESASNDYGQNWYQISTDASGLISLTVGRGNGTTYKDSAAFTKTLAYDTQYTITTIGASGNQKVTLYDAATWQVIETVSYNGNMNGYYENDVALTEMHYTANTTYGTAVIPEPTTATLSLLALAGLAARRRRK